MSLQSPSSRVGEQPAGQFGTGLDGAARLKRVIIESIMPTVDGGRFAVKRIVGDAVVVGADIFADGHDRLRAALLFRHADDEEWRESPLEPLPNDAWIGRFVGERIGLYQFTIAAWIDRFATWRHALKAKADAGQEITGVLLEGAQWIHRAADLATGTDRQRLLEDARVLSGTGDVSARLAAALDDGLAARMLKYPDRSAQSVHAPACPVWFDRPLARFGAWYELFPRSCAPEASEHGTFDDLARRLQDIARMGFDIVYLPPIHPIGESFRKGPNNSPTARPGDPGSPWAIGSAEGGHTAIHPPLGTFEEFDRLVATACRLGIEIALDIAFQCSPDHPYVAEHPEWFKHRPDGTIQYAENPPKKYQDIYPFDFEGEHWQSLCTELRDVFLFWIGHGVTVFRVDNPHTKPFHFWEWVIREVRRKHPETLFLSEAFTRPKPLAYLAKAGFTQSYTYFTWRNSKQELTEYAKELFLTSAKESLRPNFFANTPDIFHAYLQHGGRAAHQARLVLAATLSATYGIYSPPFELCEPNAIAGTEEYQDSEKYQIRHWDLDRPGHIRDFIQQVNQIRRENPSLQSNDGFGLVDVDNDQLFAFRKWSPNGSNPIVVLVNLNPHQVQWGMLSLPLWELGIGDHQPYTMHDLLNDARYTWVGGRNFVKLDPAICPAHVFRIET